MENIILNLLKYVLLLGCTFAGYVLGWYLTEKKDLSKYPLLDFKAFKCRKCLTFHLCWVMNTFVGLCFNDIIYIAIGITFAAFVFVGLLIDEKERTLSSKDFEKMDGKENAE